MAHGVSDPTRAVSPDPLVEPVHDVAFLSRAIMGVVVGGDFDGSVASLLGRIEEVASRGDDFRAERLPEILKLDLADDARAPDQPMKHAALEA